jgi:hypothetical protein
MGPGRGGGVRIQRRAPKRFEVIANIRRNPKQIPTDETGTARVKNRCNTFRGVIRNNIPKGLNHSARGWRTRAYHGGSDDLFFNPEGVGSFVGRFTAWVLL